MQSIIASPADGARLRVAGDLVRVLASSQQTGGSYEIFEVEAIEGSGPPLHMHPWAEAYVVIDGEAAVWIEGEQLATTKGCFIQIPANVRHSYRVTSKTAKFVVITSPAGANDFFVDVDDETDMTKIVAVALRHGFTVPPPA